MEVTIVDSPINIDILKKIAAEQFGDFVKAVIDVEREMMAIGGELHADEEVKLSETGSKRKSMWGINLYPEKSGDDFIEFDSMINIKPQYNNRSRGVEDLTIQEKIKSVVNRLIK